MEYLYRLAGWEFRPEKQMGGEEMRCCPYCSKRFMA